MSTFAVILPAAGRSTRFGDPFQKKVFVDLQGRPVWVRTAEAFLHRPDVEQVVLAISPEDHNWFREKFAASLAFMNVDVVEGGAERADTVERALAVVKPGIDFVAVHDAARPLIADARISHVFAEAQRTGAAILATEVSSTVKRAAEGLVNETVDRRGLWLAQTPQVFRRQLLLDAYAARNGRNATDDAQLVEWLGHPVACVPGSPLNLKLTNKEDLRIAAALLDLLPGDGQPGTTASDSKQRTGLW
ncbi:MAG: 2-C-methyl-D-erythritol 4-phosphate cytidylyltransferase [Planctomycetaceae bacterium]